MKIEFGKFFLRIGEFHIGVLPKPEEPTFLPELIMCRDSVHAREIKRMLPDDTRAREIDVAWPIPSMILCRRYPRITVLPGVNLDAYVGDHGRLRDLLHAGQKYFGATPFIVDLTSQSVLQSGPRSEEGAECELQ